MKKLFVFILLLITHLSFAQVVFYQSNQLEVFDENNNKFKYPFTGGLHFPVFAGMDLNFDGHDDLIILDRADNRTLTYINAGKADTVMFYYMPQFESLFPEFKRTVLVYDFDRDGKPDIFSFAEKYNSGLEVYRNESFDHLLSFKRIEDQLLSLYFNNPPKASIYLSDLDIPVLYDIDGDSDMDILTFYILGNFVDYYENLSIEKYGVPDSLDFEYAHGCWGYFEEDDLSSDLLLGVNCGSVRSNGHRHAGSTSILLDYDEDGDLDMLLGDVENPGIKLLINGKNDFGLNEDSIISVIDHFPANDVPVNIHKMPAIFRFDADNDGMNDYLFSPLDEEMADTFENINHTWLYLNNGKENKPELNLNRKNFLTEDMIDFGGTTKPVFFDCDQDGDEDLVVATRGNFVETYYKKDRLVLFENIGNNNQASFRIANDDYLSLSLLNSSFIYPAFGDVDGDGDKDLLIGKQNGKICFYRNTASIGQMAKFDLVTNELDNIDVGENSAPVIYDLNFDGKNDLIISERNGIINYFENISGGAIPTYDLKIDTLGGLVYQNGLREYVNIEIADIDNMNGEDLIVGVLDQLFYFPNIRNNYQNDLVSKEILIRDEVNKVWINKPVGFNLKAAVSDLDGDGKSDMLLGSDRGGLLYYSTQQDTINVGVENVPAENELDFLVYPNPVIDYLNLETVKKGIYMVTVYDMYGKLMLNKTIIGKKYTLAVNHLPTGIYTLVISDQNFKWFKTIKLLKVNK